MVKLLTPKTSLRRRYFPGLPSAGAVIVPSSLMPACCAGKGSGSSSVVLALRPDGDGCTVIDGTGQVLRSAIVMRPEVARRLRGLVTKPKVKRAMIATPRAFVAQAVESVLARHTDGPFEMSLARTARQKARAPSCRGSLGHSEDPPASAGKTLGMIAFAATIPLSGDYMSARG